MARLNRELGRDASGRPTRLTEEHIRKIVHAILAGNYLETAASYANIYPKTLRNWLVAGAQRNASALQRELTRRVNDAVAVAEVNAIAEIRAVGAGLDGRKRDWKALAWWLERKFPDRWARKTPEINVNVLGSPEWEEIKHRILRCLANVPGAHEAIAREFGTAPPAEQAPPLEATSLTVQ